MVAYVKPRWRRDVERRNGEVKLRHPHTFAAIDLGTNNCRLLVARPSGDSFQVIDAFSRIVRLGEGMGKLESLTDVAMSRTIEALQICAAKMRRHKVDRARLVATDACRRAVNSAMRAIATMLRLGLYAQPPRAHGAHMAGGGIVIFN